MKPLHFTALFFLFSLTSLAQNKMPDQKIEGFSHPESVVYDSARDVFYVSNIGDKKEGDGFISKVSTAGEIIELKWITGLQDPKGLLVQDDKLFVTDKTEFVEMDIQKGQISKQSQVAGSKSLNDITQDSSGNIYFSDLSGNSIFKRNTSGDISEWLHSDLLQHPNGLLVIDGVMYVSAWGKDSPGNLLKIDMNSEEIEVITEKGIGNLDGLQKKDENSFYVSDWAGGKVYHITTEGDVEEIISAEKSVGDILFFQKKNQVILPMNLQNQVWIYNLD
ncbi:MAG: SMP-30/gluconolactonase/LRE family protein [Salinimicrobium sp.]